MPIAKVELLTENVRRELEFERVELRSQTATQATIVLTNERGEELVLTVDLKALKPLLSWRMLWALG